MLLLGIDVLFSMVFLALKFNVLNIMKNIFILKPTKPWALIFVLAKTKEVESREVSLYHSYNFILQ